MTERALSAPGKLFLAGEYAVVWGGTARVLAVGPRTGACVRLRDDGEVHLAVAEGRLSGASTPAGVRWRGEATGPFLFAARAVDLCLRVVGRQALGLTLALEGSLRSPTGAKLGLGGSARAVALAAEAVRSVLDEKFDPLKVALVAHASAQGGRGSGGDVAAIFAGGLSRYRRYRGLESLARAAATSSWRSALAESPPVELSRVARRVFPLLYVWSGQSASTPALLRNVEAALTPAARAAFVEKSDLHAEELERALVAADFRMLAQACEALEALLATLPGVETEAVRRILALGRTAGATGKLSGAGGGDGCVLFCPDEGVRRAAAELLASRGFTAAPIDAEEGLAREATAPGSLRAWVEAA